MKHLKSIAIISLALVGSLALAKDDAATVRNNIQKTMDSYCKAMVARDMKTCEKIQRQNYEADFTLTDVNGETGDLDSEIQAMRQVNAMVQSYKTFSEKITSFKIKGNIANVVAQFHFVVLVIDGKSRKPFTLGVDSIVNLVYVKHGSMWKAKSSKDVTYKTTVNGKPHNPIAVGAGGK